MSKLNYRKATSQLRANINGLDISVEGEKREKVIEQSKKVWAVRAKRWKKQLLICNLKNSVK